MKRVRITFAVFAVACGPSSSYEAGTTSVGGDDDDGATTFAGSESSRPTTTSASTSTTNATTDGATDTRADTSTSATQDEGGFIVPADASRDAECDIWIDDCPPGLKCMPWADDGGNAWNATKCTSLVDDPKDVGESCTVEYSGVSGIDDCGPRAMCWDVDPETLMGTCVAMCSGDPTKPVCGDPCTPCSIHNEGVLILCLRWCDPLVQDCDEGNGCFANSDGTFGCAPDSAAEMGALGDACEFLNVCDPGLVCADAERVPNCAGAIGCCTTFCDVDTESPCPEVLTGAECIPWFDEGEAPPCFAYTIGSCLLPE